MFLAAAVVTVVILSTLLYSLRKSSKAPPGPWGFPILGHLPLLGDHPAKTLLEWKATYGPIISVQFGSLNAVVFNDTQAVKEAFSIPAFTGRKDLSYFPEASNRKGIIFSQGAPNMEQRRFVMKAMKHFGFGNGGPELEATIQTEISELLNFFKLKSGQPMRVHRAFNISTVNAIWLCLTGKRFDEGDPNLKKLADICAKMLEVPSGSDSISYFVPWLGKLMPTRSGYNMGLKGFAKLRIFVETYIAELKASRIKDHPRNIADAYMDKVEATTDENSSFFHAKNFQSYAFSDLFIGSIDTTSTLLEWALAYLAVHQDVQRKLQKEILEVTGNSRAPCLADRLSMPYSEAIVHELIRIAPLVALNLGRQTMEDVIFRGYFIPKETLIYANYYGLCHDPQVWGDPQNFRPERFIDDAGKFRKYEQFLPFGYGKRNCIGESLARDQSFLYTASLFQKFNVTCVPGKTVNLEGKFGNVVHPDPSNEVILTERI